MPVACQTLDETDLLTRLRAGDPQGYETLLEVYGGRLHAAARRVLRCEQDSADAVQDALLAAFQSLESFEGHSQLGTWLHRIVINACLMKLRARSRRPTVSLEETFPAIARRNRAATAFSRTAEMPHEPLVNQETRAHVRQCIDQLPESCRAVLVLRDLQEYDTDKTALLLGTSRGAVKTRLHRARQALRTLLEPHFVE